MVYIDLQGQQIFILFSLSRLEKLLSERETEVLKLSTELREVAGKLKVSEELISASINQEEELERLRKEVEELKPRNLKLQNNLTELEKQNIEVGSCYEDTPRTSKSLFT